MRPTYAQAFRQVLSSYTSSDLSEGQLIDVLDDFVLKRQLRNGQTIVERFVAARPDLLPSEREMLLGWRDAVEGMFEVERREGDLLIVTNLVDDLTYRVRSNMGRSVFRGIAPRSLLLARLVPLCGEWLVSGVMRPIGRDQSDVVYATAAQFAMEHPEAVFRNPSKLEQGWELQHKDRERFVRFFGTDIVVIPGTALVARMREFAVFCRDEVLSALEVEQQATVASRPVVEYNFPPERVNSGSVALIYEEIDGLGFYGGFDEFERAFTEPAAPDQHRCHRRVLSYLDDDTVSPAPFRRMAERDPTRASEVLQRFLAARALIGIVTAKT